MKYKPFVCSVCGKRRTTAQAVRDHLRDVHKGQGSVKGLPSKPRPKPVEDDESMGALFRARAIESQERRASNRENGAAMLEQAGIGFETKNFGAHLIVTALGKTFDFWPGTGLWQQRGDKRQHRGANSLIRACAPENFS